jgi:hypothetical protein
MPARQRACAAVHPAYSHKPRREAVYSAENHGCSHSSERKPRNCADCPEPSEFRWCSPGSHQRSRMVDRSANRSPGRPPPLTRPLGLCPLNPGFFPSTKQEESKREPNKLTLNLVPQKGAGQPCV